jgi:hypothetical protein
MLIFSVSIRVIKIKNFNFNFFFIKCLMYNGCYAIECLFNINGIDKFDE